MDRSSRKPSPHASDRESRQIDVLRRNLVRDVDDLRVRHSREQHALHLADIAIGGSEVRGQRDERPHHTDLFFQAPLRQRRAIAKPRPIAVNEMTPQMPALPQRFAASAATGIRDAVSTVDQIIGGIVYPAPPSAPSKTTSAHTASCDTD